MSSPALLHLLWKEYRTQRTLWIVLAVACVSWQLLAWPFIGSTHGTAETHVVIAAATIPIMFMLASSVLLFAWENEERTRNMMRLFPISRTSLFTAKFGLPLVAAVFLLVIAWTPAYIILSGSFPNMSSDPLHKQTAGDLLLSWALISFATFAWGCFYSLLTGRVMATVLLTPVTLLVLSPLPRLIGLMVVACVYAADFWLTGRWLTDKPAPGSSLFRGSGRARAVPKRFLFVSESAATWKRSLSRLLWLEWQQRKSVFRWIFGTGIVMVFVCSLNGTDLEKETRLFLTIFLCAVPYLIGVWSFHPEQVEHRNRIAAQRGLTGEALWLSKQLVWLPTAIELTFVLLLFDAALHAVGYYFSISGIHRLSVWEAPAAFANLHRGGPRAPMDISATATVVLQWALLAYACGQFMSLFFRRFVTAVIFGALPLLAAGFLWSTAVESFDGSYLWSVGWLVIAFFAATLIRSSDWMLERQSLRNAFKIVALFVVPACLIFALFAFHRVYEIPSVEFSKAMRSVIRFTSTTVGNPSTSSIPPSYVPVNPSDPKGEKIAVSADVAAMQAALAKLNWDGSLREGADLNPNMSYYAILDQARAAITAGDLDNSFAQIVRLIRTNWQTDAREGEIHLPRAYDPGMDEYAILSDWMTHPQQTAGRLHFAIQTLNRELIPTMTSQDRFLATAKKMRSKLENDWAASDEGRGRRGQGSDPIGPTRWLMPWEKDRALRVIEAVTTARLVSAAEMENLIRADSIDIAAWFYDRASLGTDEFLSKTAPWKWTTNREAPLYGYVAVPDYAGTINLLETALKQECQRRGILIACALIAYRRDHGQLPERLDALVPNYLRSVPVDLWTGRDFNYRREGFAHTLLGAKASPNQPVVWSSGPRGGRPTTKGGPNQATGRVDQPYFGLEDRFELSETVQAFPETLTFCIPKAVAESK